MVRLIDAGKSVVLTVKHLPDEGDVVTERPLKEGDGTTRLFEGSHREDNENEKKPEVFRVRAF